MGRAVGRTPATRTHPSIRSLRLAEQRLYDPRASARIAPPVRIVPLDERLRDQRLQLPGTQVARGVEPRIDVDERVGSRVAERRRGRELLDVQVGERVPRDVAAVQMRLVDQ